jgi:hypothetical protein
MNGNSTKRHVKVMKSCTESKAQHRAGRGPSQPLNLGCLLLAVETTYYSTTDSIFEAIEAVNDYIFIVIFDTGISVRFVNKKRKHNVRLGNQIAACTQSTRCGDSFGSCSEKGTGDGHWYISL